MALTFKIQLCHTMLLTNYESVNIITPKLRSGKLKRLILDSKYLKFKSISEEKYSKFSELVMKTDLFGSVKDWKLNLSL